MAYSKFCDGAIISATSFVRDQAFDVEVLSSRPVADGATAKIFLGRIDQTGQAQLGVAGTVALKLFVNNMADYQQQLLDRELRAIRRVKHPYILPYTGTAVFEFHKIIISPYMKNGNLLEYLSTNIVDRGTLLYQVAAAVNFLHTVHRMIHGDLKCENVLVSDEGIAQLADFGLSTFIERTDMSTRTATALRQLMTLQFAAPELIFGAESTSGEGGQRPARRTEKTDVYAFGMTVLQAYTGKPPWDGFDLPAMMMKVYMHATPPRPLNMPRLWWDGCVTCWNYEPSLRPSMQTLLDGFAVMIRTLASTPRNGLFVVRAISARGIDSAEGQLRDFSNIPHITSYPRAPILRFNNLVPENPQDHVPFLQYLNQHSSVDRRFLLVQVAEAVNFLHTQYRMAHGNINCENVLVTSSGRALLADSVVTEESGRNTQILTETRGCRGRSAKTDIYALGMLVLQAVATEPARARESDNDTRASKDQPRPGSGKSSALAADELWRLVVKCIASDPAARPSMREILHTMEYRGR